MACQEVQSAPLSDDDSDDEFFDALASEGSSQDHLANPTPSVKDGSPNRMNVHSSGNGTQTANALRLDGQPESEGNSCGSSALSSKAELNTEESCGSVCNESTDNAKVSNLQDDDLRTEGTTQDTGGGDNEQTTFLGTSHVPTCQQLSSGDQDPTPNGVTCEGVEAEGNESNDKLNDEEANKEEEIVVEEMDMRKEREDAMTEQEREKLKEEAQSHKAKGNSLFKQDEFLDAISAYSQALEVCPLCYKKERSIMYANRAACRVHREQNEMAVEDCNKALELHPHYLKVWLRRANTYELMEKLDEALADFKQVLELDPTCYEARAACMRLPDQIKERNEKLKEEMFSKLKDLGNLVLRPFGLSTDNFQMQQDPNTGSYSVNFRQNPTSGNGRP